jgi:hypothetical protein
MIVDTDRLCSSDGCKKGTSYRTFNNYAKIFQKYKYSP